jgi:LAO/AO transport system kinase
MQQHAVDPDIFIRSMGTRGSLGGLSRSTQEAALILDACGKDIVIIETVGVGQSEVDIVKIADTVGLILVPGMGDDIQVMKAGIMEIADVFIVNKADRDGADRVSTEVNMMLDLLGMRPWRPPVLKTVAERGEGVKEVVSEMIRHADFLRVSEEGRRRKWQRLGMEVEEILRREIASLVENAWEKEKSPDLFESLAERKTNPYEVAERVLSIDLPARVGRTASCRSRENEGGKYPLPIYREVRVARQCYDYQALKRLPKEVGTPCALPSARTMPVLS